MEQHTLRPECTGSMMSEKSIPLKRGVPAQKSVLTLNIVPSYLCRLFQSRSTVLSPAESLATAVSIEILRNYGSILYLTFPPYSSCVVRTPAVSTETAQRSSMKLLFTACTVKNRFYMFLKLTL